MASPFQRVASVAVCALLLLVALLTLVPAVAADEVDDIAKSALAKDASAEDVSEGADAIAAYLEEHPEDGFAHFVYGRILARQGNSHAALKAFDAALEKNPKDPRPHYSAGVVLGTMGKDAEASARFVAATEIDPKSPDAHYNAGMSFYKTGKYEKALEHWQAALKAEPTDIMAQKKLVQAFNALDRFEEAEEAWARLVEMRKASSDGPLAGAKDTVFDQFAVGEEECLLHRTFEPAGDLFYVYTAHCFEGKKRLRTVNLESSAVIREAGQPYVIGINVEGKHINTGKFYDKMPPYSQLRDDLVGVIEGRKGKGDSFPIRK